MTCQSPVTTTYVTVASTGSASMFPGATVAAPTGPGSYYFYKATAGAYEQLGTVNTQPSEVVCANTIKVMQYPFTYLNTFSDPFTCDVSSGGFTLYERTGTIQATADGYGTVISPLGTIPNVLRVHLVQNYEDVSELLEDTITWAFDSYMFIKPGVKDPVVMVQTLNYTASGFPPQAVSAASIAGFGQVGIDDVLRNEIGIDLMPNPATDRLEIVFSSDASRALGIEVIDASGKVVLVQQRATMAAGFQREVLDVGGLTPGIYTVRITDDRGASGTQRMVKL